MKILQITKYFYPNKGGIESNVLGISEELVKRGKRVTVLASNHPKTKRSEIYHGIKIKRSRIFFTLFRDPFHPGILIDLFQEKYDLIHLHLPDPFNSFFAWIASLLREKPLIITYHADILKERWYHKPFTFLYNFFQNLILNHSEFILATTPNYVKESSTLKKFEKKIKIVPNFVDFEKFKKFNQKVEANEIKKIKRRYSLENKKIILFLGRLIPYKGVEYLIQAFSEVKEVMKDSILVIAGEGPLRKSLVELSRGMKDVVFIKTLKDEEVPSLFASCDVFVLPSVTRQEAFGIVLLEAMIMEKPVISTNISGMPFVVNKAGILVPPRDTQALSDAIIKILSDEKLAKKLGRKARRRVKEEFTREKVVDKIEKVYEEVFGVT
jgi:rhamnosyl/mannosyltransferase